MNSGLSIVTANWWGKDWLDLLLKSIQKTATGDFEFVVVDNSGRLKEIDYPKNTRIIKKDGIISHSEGLNYGIQEACGEYIFVVDIDAHFLLPGWDRLIIDYFDKHNLKLLACQGGKLKPIRPCGMLFKKDCFIGNNMDFFPREYDGIKFDVGMCFYFKLLTLFGDRCVQYFPYQKTEYEGASGSEYIFRGKRFLYHNYYGVRWYGIGGKRTYNKINRWTWEEYLKAKQALFEQVEI